MRNIQNISTSKRNTRIVMKSKRKPLQAKASSSLCVLKQCDAAVDAAMSA